MFIYFIALFTITISLLAQPFSFIAMGDTPYSSTEEELIKSEIIDSIRDYNPPFLAFYGDLKGGGESCTDSLINARHDMIMGILPNRVFYTPGDNEWTDCDRAFLDKPFSELERLDYLKRVFFSKPMNLPSNWDYASQPNYSENARWMQDGVMFVTLHMVSTNNGRIDILKDDIELALSMVDARDQANRVWMSEAFDMAIKANAKAVVIITQADVTSADGAGLCRANNRMQCDAFKSFRQQIRFEAKHFAKRGENRRPVLLIHGDTNPYCLDKSFGGKDAPNLWRLNAWGDFTSPADATIVTVDTNNTLTPFSARTLLGKKAPSDGCP